MEICFIAWAVCVTAFIAVTAYGDRLTGKRLKRIEDELHEHGNRCYGGEDGLDR